MNKENGGLIVFEILNILFSFDKYTLGCFFALRTHKLKGVLNWQQRDINPWKILIEIQLQIKAQYNKHVSAKHRSLSFTPLNNLANLCLKVD